MLRRGPARLSSGATYGGVQARDHLPGRWPAQRPQLKTYGFGGGFEGYVTYGISIQTAPNSDQVLAIRAGELKKPDGSGAFYYVVHADVRNS